MRVFPLKVHFWSPSWGIQAASPPSQPASQPAWLALWGVKIDQNRSKMHFRSCFYNPSYRIVAFPVVKVNPSYRIVAFPVVKVNPSYRIVAFIRVFPFKVQANQPASQPAKIPSYRICWPFSMRFHVQIAIRPIELSLLPW
jgi:hypothetical protein